MENSNEEGFTEISNKVRGFMVYSSLYDILEEYIKWGDGYHATAVFNEDVFEDSDMIDSSVINLMKLLSTAYGHSHINEAIAIVSAIHYDRVGKEAVRFRSRHPLFVRGTPFYQNVCLVSGMIQFNIPILPYYNGEELLIDLLDEVQIDVERMRIDGRDK